MGTEWSSHHWVTLNATCSESIIKAASTFISHAKSWFLPVLAKPLSVLKVHLVCSWALKGLILSCLVALWRAHLELRMRNSHPKWCFLLNEFQQNKPGFSRMKHLYQLLLPTVSCCCMAPSCSHYLSVEKSSLLLLQKFLSQPGGPWGVPGGSLPSPPLKSFPPEPLQNSPTASIAGKKQLKAKIITYISRNYSLDHSLRFDGCQDTLRDRRKKEPIGPKGQILTEQNWQTKPSASFLGNCEIVLKVQ